MASNPYAVANALGETLKLVVEDARLALERRDFDEMNRKLDQAENVLDRIIDSMPPDPRKS